MTTADQYEQRELMLNRFKRLFGELMRGEISRNTFEAWEVDLLLDFEACALPTRRRLDILRQYQRAVEHQLDAGPGPPLLLSRFLVLRERRRAASLEQQNPASVESGRREETPPLFALEGDADRL